jgi:hypothetical protein
MTKITKLCRVHAVDKSKKDGRRYIHYFYVDKKWDDVNYAEIIADYKDMDAEDKEYTEEIVNEMFTAEEVELLKVYIEQEEVGMELFVKEYSLPIATRHLYSDGLGIVRIATFKIIESLEPKGTTDLVYINNGLPFKVAGIKAYN